MPSGAVIPHIAVATPPQPGPACVAAIEAAAAAGLEAVHIDAAGLDERALVLLARRLSQTLRVALVATHPEAIRLCIEARFTLVLPSGVDPTPIRPLQRAPLLAQVQSALEASSARRAGCDAVLAGPVFGASGLGAPALRALCRSAGLPVLAWGGIDPETATAALICGAHGVIARRFFWAGDPDPEEAVERARALAAGCGRTSESDG